MNADLLQDKAINCKLLFQPKGPQFILPQHSDKFLKLLSNYIKILGQGFPLLSFNILPAKAILISLYSFCGRPRHSCENSVKMDLEEIGCDDVDCIWVRISEHYNKSSVSITGGKFFTS